MYDLGGRVHTDGDDIEWHEPLSDHASMTQRYKSHPYRHTTEAVDGPEVNMDDCTCGERVWDDGDIIEMEPRALSVQQSMTQRYKSRP